MSDIIEQIKNANYFDLTFDVFAKGYTQKQLQAKLNAVGIQIDALAYEISDDLKAEVNEAWNIIECVDQEVMFLVSIIIVYFLYQMGI